MNETDQNKLASTARPELSSYVQPSSNSSNLAVPPRPAMSRDVQQRPAMSSAVEKCGTNPCLPNLTGRQLAAARLIAEGVGSARVAGELGTTQRTVNRWKTGIGFQVEVRRVHELMVLQSARRGADRPVPQRLFSGGAQLRGRSEPAELRSAANYAPNPPAARSTTESDDDDFSDVEAMIEQILEGKRQRERRS